MSANTINSNKICLTVPKTTHFNIQKQGRDHNHNFYFFLRFLVVNYGVFVASKNNCKTRAFWKVTRSRRGPPIFGYFARKKHSSSPVAGLAGWWVVAGWLVGWLLVAGCWLLGMDHWFRWSSKCVFGFVHVYLRTSLVFKLRFDSIQIEYIYIYIMYLLVNSSFRISCAIDMPCQYLCKMLEILVLSIVKVVLSWLTSRPRLPILKGINEIPKTSLKSWRKSMKFLWNLWNP